MFVDRSTSPASDLRCSNNLEFCSATNIALDFTKLEERVHKENLKYKMDIFGPGELQLRGCELDRALLRANLDHMSPLQSWAPELRHIATPGPGAGRCDLTLEQPVVVMKLDATVNMYHHFCDFFNLYLSLHMNHSLGGLEDSAAWARDKRVLILENAARGGHRSPFSAAWAAFTRHPVTDLTQVAGKVVCIKNAVFALPARYTNYCKIIVFWLTPQFLLVQDDIRAVLQHAGGGGVRGLGDGAPVLAVHAREARGGTAAAGGAGGRQAAGHAAGPRHQAQEDPQ